MPYAARFIPHLNRVLDQHDPAASDSALDALKTTSDLAAAAQKSGLLGQLSGRSRTDAQAMLAALPASLATALRNVLIHALESHVPAVVQWRSGSAFELHIWETSVSAGGETEGHISISLVTPNASDLAAST